MYETPSPEIFAEMRDAAIKVWNTKDNTYGYVTEKLERVNSIVNIQDNAMVFYRMFDHENQRLMKAELSQEALDYINHNI